jgi:hypothetical protein
MSGASQARTFKISAGSTHEVSLTCVPRGVTIRRCKVFATRKKSVGSNMLASETASSNHDGNASITRISPRDLGLIRPRAVTVLEGLEADARRLRVALRRNQEAQEALALIVALST